MRQNIFFGAVFGLLSVALGAFGAHFLKSHLTADSLSVYKTGVEYQFFHAMALLIIGLLAENNVNNRLLKISGILFIIGILLFSGSLYALTLTNIKVIGAITPFGGLSFIAGWFYLGLFGLRRSRN